MIAVKVFMKATREPLKHTPVVLRLDPDGSETQPVLTDRTGTACFDLPATSGKILISRVERYEGRLDREIPIEPRSIAQSERDSRGLPGELPTGSNAYPSMTTRTVQVGERGIVTDSEGYLVHPADWSEVFARALAEQEGLTLKGEHWEQIRYLRAYFARQGTQATVRNTVARFRRVWGSERDSNRYLHTIVPRGGPQKQGNRLKGLMHIEGEH